MVETLSPLNPNYTQGLDRATQALIGAGQSAVGAPAQAVAQLYQAVGRQAQMLSYIDVFHTLMLVVFAAIPLLFLMRGSRGGAGAGGPA
jgi:DHA2 family multidrug resistance protein